MYGFFRKGLTYNITGFSHTPHILIFVNFWIKLKDKMFLTWYIVIPLTLIKFVKTRNSLELAI